MSRNEGKIAEEGAIAVDAAAIIDALRKDAGSETRKNAVRCYFAASDGWKEASTLLGGAFADAPGLKQSKGE